MMMMMAQKNLHELLEQDQEPFLLKNYIADRRSLLKNHLRRRPKDGGVLQISEPTAALLLEAATRIHNQSTKPKSSKAKKGIFDSIFKRFGKQSRKDRIFVEKLKGNAFVAGNTTFWSEKSLDLETCCSSSSSTSRRRESGENIPATEREGSVNSSPQSPFRFSLFNTPELSSPEFLSPEVSPGRRSKQGNEIHEAKTIENYDHQVEVEVREEEEDEKEQCSPVSVLEPRFQDEEDEEEDKIDDYEPKMECSYAIMQKAKDHLLEKLRRFERLAQLDPFELDKTLFEDEDSEINDVKEEDEDCFFMEVDKSGIDGIKRLVSDLIVEEEIEAEEEEEVTKRVCMRLEKWKESKRESIDMMVEMDLRMDQIDGWKKIDEKQVKEVEKEIGNAILEDLVEELLQDQLNVLC